MREYQRTRHSSSLHSIRVRIFLFLYFVDLYFYWWAEGPSFLQKLPTGTTLIIRALFIYVGKPVGSRTDFLGEWKAQFRTIDLSRKRVYHLHKWVPLTEKRRRRPETVIKGGLKKWNSLSVGNFPSGKHGTTFSYVPLLPWNFPLDRHENSCSFTSRPEFREPVGTKRMLMESARHVAFTFQPDFRSF